MFQGSVFAEGEEVDEVLGFRARVVRRYVSHVLSFPQMLSNAPSKAGLNMQVVYTLASMFCFLHGGTILYSCSLDVYTYTKPQDYILISPEKAVEAMSFRRQWMQKMRKFLRRRDVDIFLLWRQLISQSHPNLRLTTASIRYLISDDYIRR